MKAAYAKALEVWPAKAKRTLENIGDALDCDGIASDLYAVVHGALSAIEAPTQDDLLASLRECVSAGVPNDKLVTAFAFVNASKCSEVKETDRATLIEALDALLTTQQNEGEE